MLAVRPDAVTASPLTAAAATQTSVVVAVRIRPLTASETNQMTPSSNARPGSSNSTAGGIYTAPLRKIVHPVDEQVLVFDPPDETDANEGNDRNSRWANPGNKVLTSSRRKKDMRFAFDRVFDEECTQEDVFLGTTKPLIDGVLNGFSSTVFAYGATGCGKTHTVAGSPDNPGIIFLTMRELFRKMEEIKDEKTVKISLSYLEVYNEQIRDLLKPSAGKPVHLALREDKSGVLVAGLSEHFPDSVDDVMSLILRGNAARTMSPTEANAVSSRSHAVLRIYLRQQPRTASIHTDVTLSTMSVIDLAGSERASASKNRGDRQLEGANINKSLLALGNCINALRDRGPKTHIPYRNSKLTRLLKSSLGGNCKTVMIVCVSPASIHLEETRNTLKYASRAREIKTTISRNKISVDQHLMRYTQIIAELKAEVADLKEKLALQTSSFDIETMGVQHLALADSDTTAISAARPADDSPEASKIRQLYTVIAAREKERAHATAMMDYVDGRINTLQRWFESYASASEDLKDGTPANDSYSSVVESLVADLKNERKRLRVDADKAKAQADLRRQLVNPKRITGTQVESVREFLDLETTTMSREESLMATKAALSHTEEHNRQLMMLNAQCLAGMKACVVDAQQSGLASAEFLNKTYLSAISTFAEITKRNQGSVLPPTSAPSISFPLSMPAATSASGPSGSGRPAPPVRSKSSQSAPVGSKFPHGNGSFPPSSGHDGTPQSRPTSSLSAGAQRLTNRGSAAASRATKSASNSRPTSSLTSGPLNTHSVSTLPTDGNTSTAAASSSRPQLQPKSILRKKMSSSSTSSSTSSYAASSSSATTTTNHRRVVFEDEIDTPDVPSNAITTSDADFLRQGDHDPSQNFPPFQKSKFEDEGGSSKGGGDGEDDVDDDDTQQRAIAHSPKKRSAPLPPSRSSSSTSPPYEYADRKKYPEGPNGQHASREKNGEEGENGTRFTVKDSEPMVRKRARIGSGGSLGGGGSWEIRSATPSSSSSSATTTLSSSSSSTVRPMFAKTSRRTAVPIWK